MSEQPDTARTYAEELYEVFGTAAGVLSGVDAVAAKVLRDVIESLNVVGEMHAAAKVTQFAKIVGIDLTESDQ